MPDATLTRPGILGLGPVTTGFGDPSAFTHKPHEGVDIGIAAGTEVPEPVGGTFVGVRSDPIGGLQAIVQTASGFREVFAHLASVPALASGSPVKQGDIIGTSGATGLVTGPHLHYEVRNPQGAAVDPFAFLGEFAAQPKGAGDPPPLDQELRDRIRNFILFGLPGDALADPSGDKLRAAFAKEFPGVPFSTLRAATYGAGNDLPDARKVPVLGALADVVAAQNPLDRIANTIGDLTKPQTYAKLGFTLAAVALIGIGVLMYAGGMRVVTPAPVRIGA